MNCQISNKQLVLLLSIGHQFALPCLLYVQVVLFLYGQLGKYAYIKRQNARLKSLQVIYKETRGGHDFTIYNIMYHTMKKTHVQQGSNKCCKYFVIYLPPSNDYLYLCLQCTQLVCTYLKKNIRYLGHIQFSVMEKSMGFTMAATISKFFRATCLMKEMVLCLS